MPPRTCVEDGESESERRHVLKRPKLIIAAVALVVAGGWLGLRFVEKVRHAAIRVQETALLDSSAIANLGWVNLRLRTDPVDPDRLYIRTIAVKSEDDLPDRNTSSIVFVYEASTMTLSEAAEGAWDLSGDADCDGTPHGSSGGPDLAADPVTGRFGYFTKKGIVEVEAYGVAGVLSQSTGLTTVVITRDTPMPARSVFDFMGGGGDDPRTQYFLEVYDVKSGERIADPVHLPFTMRHSPHGLLMSCDGRFAIVYRDDYKMMSIVPLPPPYRDTP
jgi:hypothetical protein